MMPPDTKEFVKSFLKKRGLAWEAMSLHRLQGDGSKRLFWRMARSGSGKGFIVMSNPPTDTATRRENLAYAMIGVHLRKKKIPVPIIYRQDLERGWFIMEAQASRILYPPEKNLFRCMKRSWKIFLDSRWREQAVLILHGAARPKVMT